MHGPGNKNISLSLSPCAPTISMFSVKQSDTVLQTAATECFPQFNKQRENIFQQFFQYLLYMRMEENLSH